MEDSDAILAAVIRSSLDCIVVVDELGCVVEFNPAAERCFGYTRDEAIGRPISETIIPPHLRDAHSAGFARYLAGGEPQVLGRRVEVEAMRRDGSTFPVELAITEVKAGRERLFTASLRDVSERREMVRKVRDGEARLAAFFDHAPAAMLIKTRDGHYERVNAYTGTMMGRPADEIIGKIAGEVVASDNAGAIDDLEREVIETGQARIVEQTYDTGGKITHTMTARFPICDADGELTHIGVVLIDITDRVEAERKLRDSETRLSAFLEHVPAAMYLKDRSGRYALANRFMSTRLGYGKGELIGKTPEVVLTPESLAEAQEVDQIVTSTGEPHVSESEFETTDGPMNALAIRFPVYGEDGDLTYIGGVVLDTTKQKRAEEEVKRSRDALYQSEKMSAMGSMLAGVSHELNNPLAIIVGEAILMEEEAEGTPFAGSAARIRRAAERCSRIVQTFLAMARQKTPERIEFDINEAVEAAVELTAYGMRSNGVDVTCKLADGLPPAFADADQIQQVVINLLINAQQALQEQPAPRAIHLETAGAADSVTIRVADNGAGIPAEIAGRIFDPFFTTKPQGSGTGIGLSFSQGVVEAHGGTLTLVEGDRGATFLITLPVGGASRPSVTPSRNKVTTYAGRALVVDDEPELAAMLARFVEREGFHVEVVSSGREALARIGSSRYDLILSDLRMPDVDGPALHAWMVENHPELIQRLGFLTGDTLGPAAVRFLDHAERPVVEKPFTRESLRGLIDQIFGPQAQAAIGSPAE